MNFSNNDILQLSNKLNNTEMTETQIPKSLNIKSQKLVSQLCKRMSVVY